jgi:hypothetical protein
MTFEPSKGGMGIKFITPRLIFMMIMMYRKLITSMKLLAKLSLIKTAFISEQTKANVKLAKGPAKATKAISRFGFLNFSGWIGTGFAQAKSIGIWVIKIKAGKIMLPKRSR